jgi:hypothetical protein
LKRQKLLNNFFWKFAWKRGEYGLFSVKTTTPTIIQTLAQKFDKDQVKERPFSTFN